MNNHVYAIDIKKIGFISFIGLVLGSLLVALPVSSMVSIVIIIIGLLMIVVNGAKVYVKMHINNENSNQLLFDVIGVLAGFILLVSPKSLVMMGIAFYLLIETFIRWYTAKFNRDQIREDLPKLAIVGLLVVVSIGQFDLLFKAVGIVLLLVSLGYFGYNYLLYKKSGVKIIK